MTCNLSVTDRLPYDRAGKERSRGDRSLNPNEGQEVEEDAGHWLKDSTFVVLCKVASSGLRVGDLGFWVSWLKDSTFRVVFCRVASFN